jgi:hypothetical protein
MIRHTIIVLFLAVTAGASDPAVFFREDWKEIPASLPVTQEHVSNPSLTLGLHGPGKKGIKKSHHENKENDPFYIWSGKCSDGWALSLTHNSAKADLSHAGARVRWRSRQSGDHQLYVLLKTDTGWLISKQSDDEENDVWHDFELKTASAVWRIFDVKSISAGDVVEKPDISAVSAVGFTDLKKGKGSKSSSRIDWIEVQGAAQK